MSHGHSHGGGGGDHGHSHGGGGGDNGKQYQLHRPGGAQENIGPEDGVFDGYALGDQHQTSRYVKYHFQVDPQLRRALYDAQRTARKSKNDHGHSHGGEEKESMMDAAPTPNLLEQYCYSGYLAHVILLHAQGIDMKRINNQYSDTNGATTLMWAALNGHLPVVKFLKEVGVDVNSATSDGQTAAHWAVTEGHVEVVKFLGENGADFSKPDVRGFDAYCTAIQQENFPMLVLLNELQPMDPSRTDADGHTYTHWCAYRNNLAALEYCHQVVKCPLDAVDKARRTALHWAAREGGVECIAYLLANGCVATATDTDGVSCIAHADNRGHVKAVAMLKNGTTQPISYLTSTMAFLSTRVGMCLFLSPMLLMGVFFGLSFFIPFFLCAFMLTPITAKNTMVHAFSQRAVRATVLYPLSNHEKVTSFLGALRGTMFTRRRDPFTFGFWIFAFAFEFFAFEFFRIRLPPLFIPLAIGTFFFAFMTKRSAYASVIQPKSLQHSDLVKAVKDGRVELLNGRQMDIDRHVRLPLRAGYCHEVDRYFRRYDSWTLLLDCPITASNAHWNFFFLTFLVAHQLYVAYSSYNYLNNVYCDDVCSIPMFIVGDEGFFASLAFMLSGGMTCRDLMVNPDTFYGRYRPSFMNTAAVWIFGLPFALGAANGITLYYAAYNATLNITRAEQLHPYAMSSNGKLVTVLRSQCGGLAGETVYGAGSRWANLLMFMLGRQTVYARSDEYELPAPAPGSKLVNLKSSGGCC